MSKRRTRPKRGVSGNPARRAEAEKLLGDEQIICEICRAPLNFHNAGGVTIFQHGSARKTYDHEPFPTVGKADATAGDCDFCGMPKLASIFVTEKPVVIIVTGMDGQTREARSFDERWSVCGDCAPMIEKGKLHELLDRVTSIVGFRENYGHAQRAAFRSKTKDLYEAFFDAKPHGPFPIDHTFEN